MSTAFYSIALSNTLAPKEAHYFQFRWVNFVSMSMHNPTERRLGREHALGDEVIVSMFISSYAQSSHGADFLVIFMCVKSAVGNAS